MSTNTSSATSLNFIGFDEMKGNGTSPILYNRIVILPKLLPAVRVSSSLYGKGAGALPQVLWAGGVAVIWRIELSHWYRVDFAVARRA